MLLRSSSEASVDRHPSNPAAEGFIKVDTEEGLGNEEMSTERGQGTAAAVEAVTTLAVNYGENPMTLSLLLSSGAGSVFVAAVVNLLHVLYYHPLILLSILEAFFLLMFSVMMVAIDLPTRTRVAVELREFAEGFLKILMRITGKGVWYVYLGSAVFSSMRANKCWSAGAWLLGGYTFLVGMITGALGFSKSRKLNRIRREIGLQFDNDAERIYEAFAVDDPSRGMTREEFAAMTSQLTSITLRDDEVKYIYSALCTGVGYRNSKGELTASELRKWMNTRFTLL
ncbi:conserved hypothetical protein [Perkinsus marinus ATCC 50983]|uniref:Uncharacterized protein n=1 Tax=Perkinsus marinus (strain ATCC 50983 / TXsc) TaxID=423536 RepID=C5LE18_PERM5|nr:conserved hypothetical protein [Perkinsus marinus ATCC 50983]EER05016.1 conserved hypothetical protein [Perkinsus marinus ATCC 50983]|eukprot:XP_002773200.1 conserved hypothetical protein [Perkinsus marinus ATCC 50983]